MKEINEIKKMRKTERNCKEYDRSSGVAGTQYDFTAAVEEVIEDCRKKGAFSKVQRIDEKGNITLWLEADWKRLPGDMEVIELFVCYTDTGRVAYSTFIEETKRKCGDAVDGVSDVSQKKILSHDAMVRAQAFDGFKNAVKERFSLLNCISELEDCNIDELAEQLKGNVPIPANNTVISNDMSQDERCELWGCLIDVVEDWLESRGITSEDIPNDNREGNGAAIIYGYDYDILADGFAAVLGIDRDCDKGGVKFETKR